MLPLEGKVAVITGGTSGIGALPDVRKAVNEAVSGLIGVQRLCN